MKVTFIEKLRYWFDNLMTKGTVVLVGILFLATAFVVVSTGIILSIISTGDTSLVGYFWASIMHVIDAGTITGADTSDIGFLILMSIVTLCGIFVTSILIGIITTGFEERLNNLKKGNSRVIEQGHVVILGFDSNVFTLVSELVTANENQRGASIVILSEEEKEYVEEKIANEIKDLKTTRVICRTGNITDINMLSRCSLETCKSIIVNESRDFMTLKAVIAVNNYFTSIGKVENLPHIVATINSAENLETVNIISKGNAELVLIEDAISRIIAQSCRQPGLSNVLVELFDYDGDELYFENFAELEGKIFGDVLNLFPKAVVFGFRRGKDINLNPNMNTILEKDDDLILLVEDDGMAKVTACPKISTAGLISSDEIADLPENILIVGINDMLKSVLTELDNYFVKGSKVIIADKAIDDSQFSFADDLQNIEIETVECELDNRRNLKELVSKDIAHVLLLSDYDADDETSDAMTLFKLIHLRDIAQQDGKNYSITSEMRDVSNQRLADIAQVNDLVVGSNIINLILAQISENRALSSVFSELLQADGSEIYIRKASKYVKLGATLDFYQITEILRAHSAVAIGYKLQKDDTFDIVVNPAKTEKVVFTENDYIISLSQD